MIKVLGFQRIAIVAVLLGINGLLGFLAYAHFIPQTVSKERELRGVRGQVSTLQNDVNDLQIEFDQLDEQREEFEMLKKDGFFDGQSRRNAELIFEKIQETSGVISSVASVAAGKIEEDEQAKKANHQILVSPISIRIDAVNDLDVFRYLYLIEEFFPGYVSIEEMTMERTADIDGTVLRAIASDKSPPLVTAELKMMWRTMIPIEANDQQGGF